VGNLNIVCDSHLIIVGENPEEYGAFYLIKKSLEALLLLNMKNTLIIAFSRSQLPI